MKKKCMNCGTEDEDLYELAESINCIECWLDFWRDEDIGLEESFEDFKRYTLTKIKQ
jgi:hypothetical protein